MTNNKRICLLSAGHIASNPRLVKEADTLQSMGYLVRVIACQKLPRIEKLDRNLSSTRQWQLSNVSWNFRRRIMNHFSQKKSRKYILARDLSDSTLISYFAPWASKYLSIIEEFKPHLIIAHHVPTLLIAAEAKRRFGCKYAFDMEDFHPEERAGGISEFYNLTAETVLRNHLSSAEYISAASPMMAEYASSHFQCRVHPILNVFPKMNLLMDTREKDIHKPLSLFWVSQVIGLDRGLIDILNASALLKEGFELHLRGTLSRDVRRKVRSMAIEGGFIDRLHLYSQIPPDDLPALTAKHDVGLALDTGFSLSNDITITNKILMYLASGLAIAASKTKGQEWLMQQLPDAGFLYPSGDHRALADKLRVWINSKESLNLSKAAAIKASEYFCWDQEKIHFIKLVESVI